MMFISSRNLAGLLTVAALFLALGFSPRALAQAQTDTPSAPAPQAIPDAPSAPATAGEPKFPPVNPANFTAKSPTKEEVEAFLHTSWGYDKDRVWEIYAIQSTAAPGVSKVQILIAQRSTPTQIANLSFFVTPDGQHLISQESILNFGAHPYTSAYHTLQQQANGPSRGAADKKFELIEFADFQCPHCKEAQPIVDKLLQDFPQAHYVFENFPLVNIHPTAYKAATWSACVFQQGGNDAFFKYADSVFAGQNDLAGQGADQVLRNSVIAAGLDPDKISACADSPAGKNAVDASMKLGNDLGIDETPMLLIDGRTMPMLAVPYDQLKTIIEWQFSLDK
ncbi:MAG: thioredoxin domain-containing protein [Acidobacteriaceae bacterium]